MARYARSQGKGPQKRKRDKLKASIHYDLPHGKERGTKTQINDGDPGVYRNGTKLGSEKSAANPNLFRKQVTKKSSWSEMHKHHGKLNRNKK